MIYARCTYIWFKQISHILRSLNLCMVPQKGIVKAFRGCKVSKGAKIRNRYNQVPYLTQDTNGKVTSSQPDTTNESQEVSPLPAGDLKVHINRRAQRHSKHKTEKNIKDPQKKQLSFGFGVTFFRCCHLQSACMDIFIS